jgi:hypothetical protein
VSASTMLPKVVEPIEAHGQHKFAGPRSAELGRARGACPHLRPPELLMDFQDTGELVWMHPDEMWVIPNDGIDGPWPGPRWER